MAFFVVRGKQLVLVHGVRKPGGSVFHKKLHVFRSHQELREMLGKQQWFTFQRELESRFPDLEFDWQRLREQGRSLIASEPSPEPSSVEEQVLEIRRAIQSLQGKLASAEEEVLLRCGHDLRNLVYRGATLLDRWLDPAPPGTLSRPDRWYPLLHPDEAVDALVEHASQVWQEGDKRRAQELFRQAQERLPFEPDPINSYGVCCLEDDNLELAQALFERAAELARHRLPLGRRSFSWGEVEVRPYVRALHNLGLVLEAREKLDEAIAQWQKGLTLCPDRTDLSLLIGAAHHRLGHLEEATQWYQRNLDWTPDERYNLAAAHLTMGQVSAGIEDLVKAFPLNPYIPTLLLEDRLPESSVHHYSNAEDEDWADSYVEQFGDLWDGQPLEILNTVWADPAVREACNELQALRRSLNLETEGPQRHALVQQVARREKTLLGRQAVRELIQRLLGPSAEP